MLIFAFTCSPRQSGFSKQVVRIDVFEESAEQEP